MTQTRSLLEAHLSKDAANMIHRYLLPDIIGDYNIALSGYGELCLEIQDIGRGLRGACEGGHHDIIDLLIARKKCVGSRSHRDWDHGLAGACSGGHLEIAQKMMGYGAANWNEALVCACYGGNIDLVKTTMFFGGNDWNEALYTTCCRGHREIVRLMIYYGATYCSMCDQPADAHS